MYMYMYINIYIYIYIYIRHRAAQHRGPHHHRSIHWLRTDGVNTNRDAAKVVDFDGLGTKGTPWHFLEDKSRLTGVPKKSLCQKHESCSVTPSALTPVAPSPTNATSVSLALHLASPDRPVAGEPARGAKSERFSDSPRGVLPLPARNWS